MNNLRTLTYYDIFEKHATYNGAACALHFNNQEISFSKLFSQTRKFSTSLKQFNLPQGSRIAVLCKNHPVFFHLLGAASALNLVLVLINRRLSIEEMSHIVSDTTPEIILCDPEMKERGDELCRTSESLKTVLVVDDTEKAFQDLYDQKELETAVDVGDTDPYIIIHTAAVMGKPRGAVLSQSNVILSNQQMIEAFQLKPEKTYLNILPLFHIMGINLGLGTLQAGGKNVIQEKFDPQQALELIQDHRINLFGSFPPIISSLLDVQEKTPYDLSSLEITAGLEAPDTAQKWEAVSGATFWTLYGQTETSGLVTSAPYFDKPGSAGKTLPLATLRIGDDADHTVPEGEAGEILVRGPLVFQGYWNEKQLNAQTFRHGWHHTGDLGILDTEGYLFFKGRKPEKELIKPGGENVFPAEVEQAIMEHEAVKEVCVFGVPDKKFGEGIKALCALHEGANLTDKELIEFCGQRIAGYKKPRIVEFVNSLPKTDSGTIDRDTIKKEYT